MAVDVAPRVRLNFVGALFGAGVLAQIAYPLVTGTARNALTVVIVLTVAAASLCHAALTRGGRAVATLAVVTVCGGFAVEVLGVHTGVPFGRYAYATSLGPCAFGVPVVIAFAWTMLAWPAALVAHRLVSTFAARVLLGAWALAAWDLFLDPQMVAAGHWRWVDPAVHLPGVPAVPISDYLGWFAVSVLMSVALQWVLLGTDGDDRWPLAFYLWTWASSTLALAVFLGLGAAAVWGFLAMGTVAVPLVRSLARSR
ncbi:MAG TPA: carotenoid biosynthesis protein [Jatrophihabitantaceae bacterium]|jgi:putative membrane protein